VITEDLETDLPAGSGVRVDFVYKIYWCVLSENFLNCPAYEESSECSEHKDVLKKCLGNSLEISQFFSKVVESRD